MEYGALRIAVQVSATGYPDPDGFRVVLGEDTLRFGPTGGDTVIPGLPVGVYHTTMVGVASWCAESRGILSAMVQPEDTTRLAHLITCGWPTSTVRVVTLTSSVQDPDPDGYRIEFPGGSYAMDPTDTVLLHPSYWDTLRYSVTGLAAWCTTDSTTRTAAFDPVDTVTVIFPIQCGPSRVPIRLRADLLGTPPAADTILVRVGSGDTVRLAGGESVTVAVRQDLLWIRPLTLPPTCISLSEDSLLATADTGEAPPITSIEIACGTVSVFVSSPAGHDASRRYSVSLSGALTPTSPATLQSLNTPELSPDHQMLAGLRPWYDFGTSRWLYSMILQPAGGGIPDTLQRDAPDAAHWQEPTWTPDGKHFTAYIRPDSGEVIHVRVAIATGAVDTLVLPAGAMYGTVQSPDGSRFAFTRNTPSPQLVIAQEGDTVPVATYPIPAYSWTLAWSPDQGRIAFVGHTGPTGIYTLTLATGVLQRLTAASDTTDEGSPEWSPDGSLIVFSRYYCCTLNRYWRPMVIRSTGGVAREFARINPWAGPYWLP